MNFICKRKLGSSMIDTEFESIIRKMADKMAKTILAEVKFKALLKD
jgi:hypothetical protein